MENMEIRPKRRGRKRKRTDNPDDAEAQLGKKQVIGARPVAFVGRYIKKDFEGSGVLIGKIVSYNRGLYRVEYEDGDHEDLNSIEIRKFNIKDDCFDKRLIKKMKKLDKFLSRKNIKAKDMTNVSTPVLVDELKTSEIARHSDLIDRDGDVLSDSCEQPQDHESGSDVELPSITPPYLTPSTGNIGVPDEYVSHLFSVYSFLRSFSIRLFLSPFTLDDFVGSLNCTFSNTLLDAIHVALLRAIRQNLESISADGSELASKFLRYINWSLLDTLTWPAFLVQYLMVLGSATGPEWERFYIDALERDYHALPAGRKLMVLQVLCNDVLDSSELRAEIDIREESEVGLESDAVAATANESGRKRGQVGRPKSSGCKNGAVKSSLENAQPNSHCSSTLSIPKATDVNTGDDVEDDGNGDECRLCGMDGTLLCCDGCPSAYHSRCIGINKMFLPEGPWYCQECTINKIYPMIMPETSLRGAKIFGIDQYGQLFVGTCDHLLVLNTLDNSGLCVRYYNQKDIPKALEALCLSIPYIDLYFEICRAIVQNWNHNQDLLSFIERIEMVKNSAGLNGSQSSAPLPFDDENQISCAVEREKTSTSLTTNSNLEHADLVTPSLDLVPSKISLHNSVPAELAFPFDNTVLPEQSKVDTNMSSSSCVQPTYSFSLSQQRVQEKLRSLEHSNGSKNKNHNYSTYVNGATANVHSQVHMLNGPFGGKNHKNLSDCMYMGLQFKCHTYLNHYTHGDFAASAAANLAVVMSEENRTSGLQASDRKVVSASISLQIKAFSSASIRFFWPHSEKKLVEIPRERCGWCFACRASFSSKRGCLLNAAASNAIKGATKILSGLRPVKSGEGCLPSIATYIMVIEESLFGLTVGPFQNANFRKQWRKDLEQASTCKAIKSHLLELEENIRAVTLSVDWIKLVDILSIDSSTSQNVIHASGSTQKRPGRRGRKPAAVSEVTDDDTTTKLNVFTWWRGGKLSKLIFQRGILPSTIVKKASRIGGSRKITGVHYTDGSVIPKQSRQLVWRSAVEMSKNTSQLALQVRYLDLHIKWNDLVRPEQNIPETKAAESEASAFRNAFVCARKVLDDKIIYGVAFGNQKHLPSRVMKSIIEVERGEAAEEIYWFHETGIPLYLIKDYECKTGNACLPLTHKPASGLSKLQRNQLKASRKNIFNYLTLRRDNLATCYCASCHLDVLLGSAVTCRACQGYCHERCAISSKGTSLKGEVELFVACKKCHRPGDTPLKESNNESPSSPLLLLRQDYQKAESVPKSAKQKVHAPPLAFVQNSRSPLETKSVKDKSSSLKKTNRKICSWGLIWRKKNMNDSGTDFRLKNLLLKGNSDRSWAGSIECHLCHTPYNPNLIYIRCDTCGNWYHGDAVELDESKIVELLGFKCCRCRRIRSPLCPYLDPRSRKLIESKRQQRTRVPKQGNPGGSDADIITTGVSQLQNEAIVGGYSDTEPATPALTNNSVFSSRQDDHLLVSHTKVPQFSEDFEVDASSVAFVNGPKKLQVRRQLKPESRHQIDDLSLTGNDGSNCSVPNDEMMNTNTGGSVAWEASEDGFQEELGLDYDGMNYEDMEFEPQTYFSFTELLDTDEGIDDIGQTIEETTNKEENSGIEWRNTEENGNQDEQMLQVEGEQNNNTALPCKMCCQEDPVPDLRCQNCGLIIHNHCSPWVEESSLDSNWRCGHCRDWR